MGNASILGNILSILNISKVRNVGKKEMF